MLPHSGGLTAALPRRAGAKRTANADGARTGCLVLEDGTTFPGVSVGAEGVACGEAVFTTAMTGYQEVVTDPSFAEQLVCFTAPMIGNYGVDLHARSRRARTPARC